MNETELYEQAIKKWGVISQIHMLMEECAELIVVLAKLTRFENGSTIPQIINEMVDVEIMLEQFKLIIENPDSNSKYPHLSFDTVKKLKLKRLKERLEE